MIVKDLSALKINKLTQEQYSRLVEDDLVKEDELYLIPELETPVTFDGKARVGQVLSVHEVNENGSPIVWSVVNNYSWSMTEITLEEDVASVYIPYEGTDIQEIRILIKPPAEWTASNSYFSLFDELSNANTQHFMHLNTQVISTNGMWLESKFTDTAVVSSAHIMTFYMWQSGQSYWNKWFDRTLKPYTGIQLTNSSAGFLSGTYFKVLVRGAT